MVFSILSYFTISKNYFINYTIPFYNTPNIPKLYFFLILFKYSFLTLLLFLFFSSFSSLSLNLQQTHTQQNHNKKSPKSNKHQKSTYHPSKITKNPKSIANHSPVSDPNTNQKSKSKSKIQNPQQITHQSPIQIKIKIQNPKSKPETHHRPTPPLPPLHHLTHAHINHKPTIARNPHNSSISTAKNHKKYPKMRDQLREKSLRLNGFGDGWVNWQRW